MASSRRSWQRSSMRAGHAFGPDSPVVGAGALLALIENSHVLGVANDVLLEGVAVDLERLRGPRARISWAQLTRALDNAVAAGVRPAQFEALGRRLASSPHMRVTRLAGFFVRPEYLMYVALRWVGPALFPVIDHELRYAGREIDLILDIAPNLKGSAPYMHICAGTFSGVPLMLGHPPAQVRAVITERRGEFHIRCPRRPMTLSRVTRAASALLSAPRVIAVLSEQEAEVRATLELATRWQRQFADMLDAMPDGVLVVRGDDPAAIVYANPALCRILGSEHASQLTGRDRNELIHPDDHGRDEVRLIRSDGTWVHCELSEARPIYFDGESAMVQVVRDVSLRRQLQGHLAVADKMATLTTLAAGIAHELNNPLTLLLANLELHAATRGMSPELDAALEGARRAAVIVGDLRMLSRPEGDDPEPVQVAEVIQSSVTLAAGRLRTTATVDVRIEGAPPVLAHRGRLGQVVLNLIINAVDAFPAERPARDNVIEVRLSRADEQAIIEVRDNAGGVDPALVDRLFEPFFTTKGPGEGTGLGLAVAQGIVAGYGGRIELDNHPGVGACFRVFLPLASGAARDLSAREGLRPARILLVDDEVALAAALRSGLEISGHQVVVESSGNRAIARLEQDRDFDALVCDLTMPDGDGMALFDYVRAHNPELASRTVFITGGGGDPRAQAFLAAVDNPCIHKPFMLDDLDRAIGRLLGAG